MADGDVLQEGELPCMETPPGAAVEVDLPLELPEPSFRTEYRIDVRFRLAESAPWAEAGHEVAWAQVELPLGAPHPDPVALEEMPPVHLDSEGEKVLVTGDDFHLEFRSTDGCIHAWYFHNAEILGMSPLLNVWRAPTDNDEPFMNDWRKAGLDRLAHELQSFEARQIGPKVVRVVSRILSSPRGEESGFLSEYVYTVFGSNDVVIDHTVEPVSLTTATLPRMGMTLKLPGGLEQLTWYGRGPQESYPDRKAGYPVGVYKGTVMEQYFPYVKPQENGNKTGVRWLSLTNSKGFGLAVFCHPGINASAHHFTPDDLTRVNHAADVRIRPEIYLNLDHRMAGLGSGSCGPATLFKYRVKPERITYRVRLKPVMSWADSAAELSRAVMPLPAAPFITPGGTQFIDSMRVELSSPCPAVTIRYTTDGTDPDESAPLYEAPLALVKTTTVKARCFLGLLSGAVAQGTFERIPVQPAVQVPSTGPGLEYACYEEKVVALDALKNKIAVKLGHTHGFDLSPRQRDAQVGFRFSGFLAVPQRGVYTFRVEGDAIEFHVGKDIMLETDGHIGPREIEVGLDAGLHPLLVWYYNESGSIRFDVRYEGPGIAMQPIPASALFHEKKKE
jgi:hypothetical protein